jgi:tetratricopeptide (TPR) repeat protein
MEVLAGQGLQSVELQLWASRSFILTGLRRLEEAQAATAVERELADRLGEPSLICMASHDQGLVALAQGDHPLAAELLEKALEDSARISRPLTRLALAEALAGAGEPDRAALQLRETVLEPVGPSDFPDALVPRLARVQALVALAREDREEAIRRLEESVAGWQRQVTRASRADSLAAVLADLGRPVVGLIEPELELARARGELDGLLESAGRSNAVVQ